MRQDALADEHWIDFLAAYRRERIPFLASLVSRAATALSTHDRTVVAFDGADGYVSKYLAPVARDVVCCVAGTDEATDLIRLISDNGFKNVSVRITAPVLRGGPAMFPFLRRRFDAAVCVVNVMLASTVGGIALEIAHLLPRTGTLALVAWCDPVASDPSVLTHPNDIVRRRVNPTPSPDYSRVLRDCVGAVVDAGFRNVRLEQYVCRSTAPDYAAYQDMQRVRITLRTRPNPVSAAAAHSSRRRPDGSLAPILVESQIGMIVADAADVA